MARLLRGEGDPRGTPTIIAGLIFIVSLVLIVLFLEAMYYHAEDSEWNQKVVALQPEELGKVRADQENRLHSYRWVDAPNRITAIPIERAMDLEVRDLSAATATGAGMNQQPGLHR